MEIREGPTRSFAIRVSWRTASPDKFHADANAVKLCCRGGRQGACRTGRRNKIVHDREYTSFTSRFASDLFICTLDSSSLAGNYRARMIVLLDDISRLSLYALPTRDWLRECFIIAIAGCNTDGSSLGCTVHRKELGQLRDVVRRNPAFCPNFPIEDSQASPRSRKRARSRSSSYALLLPSRRIDADSVSRQVALSFD